MDALRRAGQLERAAELLVLGRAANDALLEADPGDVRSRSNAGFLEALGGDVLLALAASAQDEAAAGAWRRDARAAHDRAIELFQALEAEGALPGPGAGQLQQLLARREGATD